MWGISHRRNCHFINPDLVLAYLILAVKYWMTLVLQVETLRTLGEMELGHSVTLQLVLRKLCLGVLEAGGRSQKQTCSSKVGFAFSLRKNLFL